MEQSIVFKIHLYEPLKDSFVWGGPKGLALALNHNYKTLNGTFAFICYLRFILNHGVRHEGVRNSWCL